MENQIRSPFTSIHWTRTISELPLVHILHITMNLENLFTVFSYAKKIHPIQTFWLIVMLMSFFVSLCLTCFSNTNMTGCCCCFTNFKKVLRIASRGWHKTCQTQQPLRCSVCRAASEFQLAWLATIRRWNDKQCKCVKWYLYESHLMMQI